MAISRETAEQIVEIILLKGHLGEISFEVFVNERSNCRKF